MIIQWTSTNVQSKDQTNVPIQETRRIRKAMQTRSIEIPESRLIDFLTNCINNAAVFPRASLHRLAVGKWTRQVRGMNHGYAYKYYAGQGLERRGQLGCVFNMQIEEMGLQHAVRRPGDISKRTTARIISLQPTYIDIMQIHPAANVSSAFDIPLFCPRYVFPNFSILDKLAGLFPYLLESTCSVHSIICPRNWNNYQLQ